MNKLTVVIVVLVLIVFIVAILIPVFFNQSGSTSTKLEEEKISSSGSAIIATDLEIPWEIVFISQGGMLVTERPGRVKLIRDDSIKTVAVIDEVEHTGEGGLLGMALDPDFKNNNRLYLYFTYRSQGLNTFNRVVRFLYQNNSLNEEQIIMDEIPGGNNHNGGRIKFGPDGNLYIATGDAAHPSFAQDRNSLAGKILRVTGEGKIPADNPFGSPVYSYGHRNVQGLVWDDDGQLWATEHGPQGLDELNKIEKGGNYGWPEITGDRQKSGIISPIIQSGSQTWAPAGLVFINGKLYFAGLRGNTLFSYDPDDSQLQENFKNQFGRLRAVTVGPDKSLYMTTSNRDGRGLPAENDDKVLRIDPESLN